MQQKSDSYKKIDIIFYHQGLLFVPKTIWTELISRHHDDPLVSHFRIKKTRKLLAQKDYWPTFCYDVEVYVKDYNVCLASKTICHKPYSDFQLMPIPMHK